MANFNPLANFNQGLQTAQNTQTLQKQNQIAALKQSIESQVQAGTFDPNSSLNAHRLSILDPKNTQSIMDTFNNLSDSRKKANFEDARTARRMIEAGDGDGFLGLAQNRIEQVERLGGDSRDSQALLEDFNNGNIQGVMSQLKMSEQAGVELGFLKDLDKPSGVSVQSSKILDDGTIISVLKGGQRQVTSPTGEVLTGQAAKESVAQSRDQAHNRKIELKKLDQRIKSAELKENVLSDQHKTTQKGNIRRIGELSNTVSGRNSAVKKATKFLEAFKSGEAHSGAARKGLSFVPGAFTSQAQFDEEFNAFSEVAARQQLKASGETRPTDADVQGMKQAMFGIGRDEEVNMQLLNDFITDQHSQTGELDQLINASKDGNLSTFTFNPNAGEQSQAGQQQLEQHPQSQVDLSVASPVGQTSHVSMESMNALRGLKMKGRQVTQGDLEHTMKTTGKSAEEIIRLLKRQQKI
ncbi:MAG TPA: hypothetical protein EYN67_15315 [Flavobacteriales bacterium]|nr:hypothetical protein [Flavobacteriales bacterium]